jgi:methylmalonyl-CoA mutase N-terminal domain/subunit
MLRFHTQTAGVSLTAQQPEVNIARVAIEALAGVLGGTQSLHTDSFDEALALPTERASRIALRTQQVIAYESGVTSVADPLGGSYFVEELTDEMERGAEEIFSYLDGLGKGSILEGVFHAIEEGWFQSEIGQASADFERKLNDGRRILVGVNKFSSSEEEDEAEILYIGPEAEHLQRKVLDEVKRTRDDGAVRRSLNRLKKDASDPETNVMPALLETVKAYATVGETISALGEVFGTWTERAVV